jgi:hypothetical protein
MVLVKILESLFVQRDGGAGLSLVRVGWSLVTCLVVSSLSLSLTSRLSPYQRADSLISIWDGLWLTVSTLLLRSWNCRITVDGTLVVKDVHFLYILAAERKPQVI